MLVKVPGGRLIVVDAKVSLAPYLDAMEATTDAERVARLKLFARATRAHVRKLAAKAYAAQFSTAPDFVVMYMPGDHFLAGALEADPDLLVDAFGQQVHIATPATLLALLKTVSHVEQQEKVAEDAQAIADLGRELYGRVTTLLAHIDKVSRCADSLVKAQNSVVGSVEGRLLPSARKFRDLGVGDGSDDLPAPRRIETSVRRVEVDELRDGEVRELPPPAAGEAA